MLGKKQSVFDLDVWYMTKDYKDLYKIIYQRGNKQYTVIVYYSGSSVYYGTLEQVQHFMNSKCLTHDNYVRWCFLNGK